MKSCLPSGKEEERKQFIALFLKSKEKPERNLSLVITGRSDFIGKCTIYPDLNSFVNDHVIQLGPMSDKELRLAIAEPAGVTVFFSIINKIFLTGPFVHF